MTPAEVSDVGQKSIEQLEFLPKPCLGRFILSAFEEFQERPHEIGY